MDIYIIGDCHGNSAGLNRALIKSGIIDNHAAKDPNAFVVQIGDLINAVQDSKQGDLECIDMAAQYCDLILLGNHEIPYYDPDNAFSGFHHYQSIQLALEELEDQMAFSFLVDNTLVTHAGISEHFIAALPFGDERLLAIEIHGTLDKLWDQRNFQHSWISSIGRARGGWTEAGGILWCDFDDEFVPTKFPQIVGHTPRGVRMKKNALCIDVGSKNPKNGDPFVLKVV